MVLLEVLTAPNYTVFVPIHPTSMAIYVHSRAPLPHANGRKGKTLYNFQEEIARGISAPNPSTIVVVIASKWQSVLPVIRSLLAIHCITNIVTGGWSLGGNDALELASRIGGRVILMDSNHTNSVDDSVFALLLGKRCEYISNNLNATKLEKTRKARMALDFNYRQIEIPQGTKVSDHRFCRDYAIDENVYGEMLNVGRR